MAQTFNLPLAPSAMRPNFAHMATAPELSVHSPSDSQYDDRTLTGHRSSAKDLLEALNERSNDEYKTVVFRTSAKSNPDYQNRVSFDTVETQLGEDPLLDFSDEDYYSPPRRMLNDMDLRRLLNELDIRGRGRENDLLPMRSPGTSPATSPTRMLSPICGMDMVRLFQNAIKYPTTPIITRRGCTFTKMHNQFEDLYLGKLLHKGLCPVLPGRVILVYISGRKHTWVAMDWILRSFIEHGDTVIIVSAINYSLDAKTRMIMRPLSPSHVQQDPVKKRIRERCRPEYVKQVAANVMRYAMKMVNPKIIAKITVEICEGPTKGVLKDMCSLYEPNLVATASKVNARKSAPLKSWNSSRLSDRLVKNFPLPVIVVPALNMGHYENFVKNDIERSLPAMLTTMSESTSKTSDKSNELAETSLLSIMKVVHSQDTDHSDDEDSVESHSDDSHTEDSLHSEAMESDTSSASFDSFEEIADLYNEYRHNVCRDIRKLTKESCDEQYFANFVRAISDHSLLFCEDLRGVDPDFRGQGAKLARVITGSNSFGAVPFKTKSLLAPVETSTLRASNQPGISISELKRSLKLNAMKHDEGTTGPSITVDPPSATVSPTSTPKPTALTFSEQEKPARRKSTVPLKKYLSYEETSGNKVNIEPSKSHPDIRMVMTTDSEKKKKKKKFWGLFKV